MRLATFTHAGLTRAGVVRGELVHPVAASLSMVEIVEQGIGAALDVLPGVHLSEVRLEPPLRPPSFRDFVAFEQIGRAHV